MTNITVSTTLQGYLGFAAVGKYLTQKIQQAPFSFW